MWSHRYTVTIPLGSIAVVAVPLMGIDQTRATVTEVRINTVIAIAASDALNALNGT